MKQTHEIMLEEGFARLPCGKDKGHSLEVIMLIALCTYLSGGSGFYDMETFGKSFQGMLLHLMARHIGGQQAIRFPHCLC